MQTSNCVLVVLVLAVAVAGSPLPQQEPPKFSSPSLGDDGISRSLGDHASRGMSDSIALKEPEEGVDHLKPADAEQTYSQPDLSTLLSITETPKLISPSTVTSSVENIDKLENMQNMDLSTNSERRSRLLFDSNAGNKLHASSVLKGEAVDIADSSNQKLEVTHQVNHVMFEVSEVGPSRSTLPLPTMILNATQPITVILPRHLTTTTLAPVFVPRISVDGLPLPRSNGQSGEDAPPIPTIQPTDNVGTPLLDSPQVVSGYASMTIGPKETKQNDTLLTDDSMEKLLPLSDVLDDVQNSPTSPPSILSKRKSELKAYLTHLQGVPKQSSTKVNPILDLIGYEHDIESLLPKYMIETKNVSTATFEPTLPAATTPSRGLLDLTTGSSSTEASTGVVKTTSISIQHDKPFKREAVDKPSTNLRFSDSSSYSDYEKEDSNLFSFDPSSRDPRIYIDYSDIEAEKAKHKKDSAKILSSTQPPVMDDKKINKAVLLESKQLKKQNETGTYETVVFNDELGKSLEPNIPFVRTLTDSSSVNLEESPPVNSVNSKENMDFTKVEEDEDVIAGSENLARSHIASVMNGSVKRDNSSQMATVKLEKNMESVDVSLPSSPPHVSEKTRDTFLEEESSVREGFRDETLSEKIISSGNEDLEVESTDASVTDDTISQSREINEKNNILDPIETKPVTDREHDPVKDRNDSSEQGSPSTEDPRLEGSHPKVASEEEDSYAVSPPSAAAVAEAAVLTHFPVDRSKESRALDSRLTADKHVHSFVAPSVAPHEEDDAQTARGVSAARAASDVNMGYITAIVCGVLLTMLLIIGLGLFIHSQRRNLNRPKALSCDRGYAGSDSGGYLDDQCQSSYTNSHLDIPKPATSPGVSSRLTQSQSLTSSCGSAVFTLSAFPSGASVDLGDSAVTDSPAITHCRASIDQSHKSIRKPFVVYAPTTEFFSPTKDSNWVVVRRVARSASRFRRVFKEVHFKPNALPLRNLCRRAPALVNDSTHGSEVTKTEVHQAPQEEQKTNVRSTDDV